MNENYKLINKYDQFIDRLQSEKKPIGSKIKNILYNITVCDSRRDSARLLMSLPKPSTERNAHKTIIIKSVVHMFDRSICVSCYFVWLQSAIIITSPVISSPYPGHIMMMIIIIIF